MLIIVHTRSKCHPGDNNTVVPGSSTSFDYDLVAKGKGLFHSDEALLQDKETRGSVFSRLHLSESSFFSDLGESTIKLGKVAVLTANAGEIIRNCALIN
ncbi:unnamed protein product [Musa acuminata subsp. malaccensis]|uniref:(wild Malaysian banana) hypothetical protein n=1 Tax=Musa acuminata subsp. malaccensis TaxID=214687 RepID=A0A804KIH4_MUSAM|nr:unnamed protein product [Musa acuminata subsp. malaccensis]